MKLWYIYRITFSDNTFYIGYRSAKDPNKDFLIRYFSSSKSVKAKMETLSYSGEIVKVFNEQKLAYDYEQNLIFENINNPNILNKRCYKGRDGFGILTQTSIDAITEKTKARWADPEYKEKMKEAQRNSYTDERRLKSSENSKRMWTEERRKSHSEKLKGHPGHQKGKGIPKPEGFGDRVSIGLRGIAKSEDHKRKLSEAKRGHKLSPESLEKRRKLMAEKRFNLSLEEENDSKLP